MAWTQHSSEVIWAGGNYWKTSVWESSFGRKKIKASNENYWKPFTLVLLLLSCVFFTRPNILFQEISQCWYEKHFFCQNLRIRELEFVTYWTQFKSCIQWEIFWMKTQCMQSLYVPQENESPENEQFASEVGNSPTSFCLVVGFEKY